MSRPRMVALAAAWCVLMGQWADALPPAFVDLPVGGSWNQAVGMTFASDGRMFVWEKGGRVWNVENGQQASQPLIDISEEVGDWRDHGLLGFAIDPAFYTNGYIYLLYVVDYHHLVNFGTPAYDPQADQYFHDTIARLTRYQCDPATGFRTLLPGTRTILIGDSITNGIPIVHQSHGAGTLLFGHDGSLIVSCGDGASYELVDNGGPMSGSSNTGLADGIITAAEDVGSWRAQLVDSHNGKILRLDPATGQGMPDNPFFNAAAPSSPRSRVWALGLRNPFRITVRPDPEEAARHTDGPGALYIGDVGWHDWEELNVCTAGGQHFGWPYFEGLQANPGYSGSIVVNLNTPNPLFGVNGCGLQHFRFGDLIVQESLAAPSFPNPCDAAMPIDPATPTFEHTRPRIDWAHSTSGPSRTGTFSGDDASAANVGAPGSPVSGPQFGGFSSTGGAWYNGADFPPEYRGVYFHADFVAGWIRAFVFDAENNPVEIREFMAEGEAGSVVDIEVNPAGSGLYYLRYNELGDSEIRRVVYLGGSNLPPIASASADAPYGPSPHAVLFSSAGSFDPESAPLTYRWDFGDGSAASPASSPVHVFRDVEDITQQGSIVARIFELSPPQPLGEGSQDIEIIRDGDSPPAGSNDSQRQYDTYHGGDQSDFDYIGYSIAQPRLLTGLVFQEGKHFVDGGWWSQLRVQYRSTVSNSWIDVMGLAVTPTYLGDNGLSYETFEVSFTPVMGRGLRLAGVPGGSANFISVGELRMFAASEPAGEPRRFDVTLTVCDDINQCGSTMVPVWINNSPPSVAITDPPDGSFYDPDAMFTQDLAALVADAEHSTGQLACTWNVVLHHNEHTHPEPPDPNCQTSALISPHGQSIDTFFWEFSLMVTDPLGLTSAATSTIFPAPPRCPGDADFDGDVDFGDVGSALANWGTSGPYGDADDSGVVDFGDISEVLSRWGAACGD